MMSSPRGTVRAPCAPALRDIPAAAALLTARPGMGRKEAWRGGISEVPVPTKRCPYHARLCAGCSQWFIPTNPRDCSCSLRCRLIVGAPERRVGECWVWTRATSSIGYGALTHGGFIMDAHRVAWELANGPIPKGLHVLHHCDNPPCVNPEHLYAGTRKDNARDAVERGQHLCGSRSPRAKLTERDVAEIRRRYDLGGVYQYELAEEFGVTQTTVSRITRRKGWVR